MPCCKRLSSCPIAACWLVVSSVSLTSSSTTCAARGHVCNDSCTGLWQHTAFQQHLPVGFRKRHCLEAATAATTLTLYWKACRARPRAQIEGDCHHVVQRPTAVVQIVGNVWKEQKSGLSAGVSTPTPLVSLQSCSVS